MAEAFRHDRFRQPHPRSRAIWSPYLVDLTGGGADYSFDAPATSGDARGAGMRAQGLGRVDHHRRGPGGAEISTRPFQLVTGRSGAARPSAARAGARMCRRSSTGTYGKIEIDPMITHTLTLDEINKGFDLMHAGESIRSVVVGHPVAGLVTTDEIMARFRTAFRYFNTFGGNPVSCAVAMAVLDEIEDRGLQENAREVGLLAAERLWALAERHAVIGDVRQAGMVFGAELVRDRATKEPATDLADHVVNAMRQRGFLLSKLGRHRNTLKIRPPMPFEPAHLDMLVTALDDVLSDAGPPA
jgi:hypothetical protein